ncbi:alpha/beta hydrolase family protein [Cytobacillus purgationiresistens]|uniref:Fermentation-respiration switch protein FrsA (DUF1100 family) n=1 Tax=Cytobacillus purgationiresistens TaxID=863449 RepID=A0ABU0AC74_9BACI|nr:alpha/beta fold hydrolase [Cytobacillus purgationiresistens]MDQ0268402.1 fermentation-respiration switch protein FrsA (DUF1100 family) [Cytobacillus purgationiresistens]
MKKAIYKAVFISLIILISGCSNEKKEDENMTINEEMLGAWEGSIDIPQSPLSIILKLEEEGGTLSVPVQNLVDYPFSNVVYNSDDANLTMNLNGSKIAIKLSLSEGKLKGTFSQNGGTFPLELTPYEEEEKTYTEIEIDTEGGKLKAALQLPEGDGPYPLSVIIAGSGPTDKNGNTIGAPGKNDSLKMLAESLAAEGIASIRYDKRGIGDNAKLEEKEEDLRLEDFVTDAEALVEYARADSQFSTVSIIGHSEGSLIGMLASIKSKTDSFVSMAGPARSADAILLDQLQGQLPPELMKEAKEAIEQLRKGKTVDQLSPELQALFRPSVQPYLISWFAYEPKTVINDIDAPILIINGTYDLQVPHREAEMLKAAESTAELFIIEEMNHILKKAPADEDGNLATYLNPDLPIVPELITSITQFLK